MRVFPRELVTKGEAHSQGPGAPWEPPRGTHVGSLGICGQLHPCVGLSTGVKWGGVGMLLVAGGARLFLERCLEHLGL